MSRPYNRESLAPALAHHSSRGVLGAVTTTPSKGRPWRVAFPAGYTTVEAVELSDTEAYAMCLALAAAEHHARAEHERFLRELSQRDGPICLDDQLEHEVAMLRRLVRVVAERTSFSPSEVDQRDLDDVWRRALDEVKLPTKCGIHGDDTTSGRCMSCDRERLDSLLGQLDAAATIGEAEGPYAEVVALVRLQPALAARMLAWTQEAAGVEERDLDRFDRLRAGHNEVET